MLLGSIGNHQRVGFFRNVKKSQNHCTLAYKFPVPISSTAGGGEY
jgi:hypothetical protein